MGGRQKNFEDQMLYEMKDKVHIFETTFFLDYPLYAREALTLYQCFLLYFTETLCRTGFYEFILGGKRPF